MGEISSRFGSRTKNNMKVLYLISVRGHGSGGHAHSLNHIVKALSNHIETKIVTIGKGRSRILENNNSFLAHINISNFGVYRFRKEINKIIKEFKPDILHCFDFNVYNLLKIGIYPKYARIVVNKCGGPNPIDFPFVSYLVLFSEENKQWFEAQKKFKKTSIYLIPNRVNKQELISNKETNVTKDVNKFTFVRISRIGTFYQKSLEDSIRLVSQLVESGRSHVFLYIIGVVENIDILSKLKEKCSNLPIIFLTDDIYTQKASDMLYLADAVIATGRGIMEATALGKPILTPAINSDIPILVTRENFFNFFATNFSQRNCEKDQNVNMNNIFSLIDDNLEYNKLAKFSYRMFLEHFDVDGGIEKYLQVYKNILNSKNRIYSVFRDFYIQSMTFFYYFVQKR